MVGSEQASGTMDGGAPRALPKYAAEMADFHLAFGADLDALINRLPLPPESRVLDVACGDGFYSRLLANKLGPGSCVVGLDINRPFLQVAEQQCSDWDRVTFVQGSLKSFPAAEEFDLVWCAQSLYSLPEPATAVREMVRLVRPGGMLAVLENDTLHQLWLPWNPALELEVRAAEFEAIHRETRHGDKYYVARQLKELLAEAGLERCRVSTQCLDREAPLTPELKRFLTSYLARLKDRVASKLTALALHELESLVDPECPQFLPHRPEFVMSWFNRLAWGFKPDLHGQEFSRN